MSFTTSLVRHGLKQVNQVVTEDIYLRTGIDVTRPFAIRGQVNDRCNYRCQMCDFWRRDTHLEEMTIGEWQAALASLKEFVGPFTIHFIGGEPFLMKGFVKLLAHCSENLIRAGVITNGYSLAKSAAEVVAARPINVDISVDGPRPEIHDVIRGVPGSLTQISRGINKLREEQERQGVRFPLRIKTTINALNFRFMPEMVDWTVRTGATSIDLSPMHHWTPETRDHLWIRGTEVDDLATIVEAVVAMKKVGAPIETSELRLRRIAVHFRGEKVLPEL